LRLVVASNWDCSLPGWLEGAGLLPLVDAVVTSAEAGAPKPAAAVFERALALTGAAPAQAVHVGDSLDNDVEGALAAGIRPVFVARAGAAAPPNVAVVASLAELPSLV
jgi:putative hydrolase of the HAD superfamily